MDLSTMLTVVQTISIVLAILVSLGTIRGRQRDEASTLMTILVKLEYIQTKVDKIDGLESRIVVVEQSAKSAHKRIDEYIETHMGGIGHGMDH